MARLGSMADFTKKNLKREIEDSAEKHGLAPNLEARFPTEELGLEKSGFSYQSAGVPAAFRPPARGAGGALRVHRG